MKRPSYILSSIRIRLFFTVMMTMVLSPAMSVAKMSNQIRSVKVSKKTDQTLVTVKGTQRPTYTAFKLSSPKRLVVDLANSKIKGVPSMVKKATQHISGVTVSEFTSGGVSVSRLMINFRKDVAYDFRVKGNDLFISLTQTQASGGQNLLSELSPQAPAVTGDDSVQLNEVNSQLKTARKRLESAESELEKIRLESLKHRQTALDAQAEVQRTKNALESVKTAAGASKNKALGDAEKSAAKRLAKLQKEIFAHESAIAKEREAKKKLQQKLDAYEEKLADAERNELMARKAKEKAELEARRYSEEAKEQMLAIKRAKKDAQKALDAQKAAASAYRRAQENEKAQYWSVLKKRERETVVAKKRLGEMKEKTKDAGLKVEQAMAKMRKTARQAAQQKTKFQRIVKDTEISKLRVERQLERALSAAKKAEQNAQVAKEEKLAAMKKMAAIARMERQKRDSVEREASKQIQLAQVRAEAAKKESEKAREKLQAYQTRLKKAEKAARDAVSRIASAEEQAILAQQRVAQAELNARRKVAKAREEAANSAQQRVSQVETAAKRKVAMARAEAAKEKVKAAVTLSEIAVLKKEALLAKKELSRVDKQLKNAHHNVSLEKKRRAALQQKLADSEKSIQDYQERMGSAKERIVQSGYQTQNIQKELDQARDRLNKAQRVIEKQKKDLLLRKNQLAKAKDTIGVNKKRARDIAQRQVVQASRELSAAQKQAQKAQKEIASLEKRAQKEAQNAAALSRKLKEAEKTIAALASQINELRAGGKTASPPPAASKKRKGRLTQEELRLQKLAALEGKRESRGSKPLPLEKRPAVSTVKDVAFINEDGLQKVVITTSKPVVLKKGRSSAKEMSLVISDVKLGAMLERTLDVSDFGGVIERVSSYRNGGNVQIDVALGGKTENAVIQDGNTIEWRFKSLGNPMPSDVQRKTGPTGVQSEVASKRIHTENEKVYDYPIERTAAFGVTLSGANKKKKRYAGRRIDLDFKNADIHNILRLLSDVGHVNIITSDEVSGSVTIRMRNVPWDQALDVILQAKHLGMIRRGNLIRVAPLATLEKEREMEIARRKQNQSLEPLETRLIPVSYADAVNLKDRANDMLSDRGTLSVDKRTNVIVAKDIVGVLDQIEQLVRSLDTQTPQVLIEGRIVEATSTYSREIGIQWGGDFSASSATANPTGLAFPSSVGVAGGATDGNTPVAGLGPIQGGAPNPNFAVNLPAAVGTGSGGALGISLGSITNNANLNLRLSAMEEEGTLRILSSPKVLTLDNHEAHIEQGTMIPYSQVSASGVQTAFKEAKLNLTVRPHVTADASVLLDVNITRDEPDFNNTGARGDPTILKREADTSLLVSDGHTAVIGGIFTRNSGTSYKKVPFFGDIPVLGWLFKSRSDSDRRTEMLIFITPRIVNRSKSIGS